MDTVQIQDILLKDKDFIGVFPINRLPIVLIPKPAKLIINLDESWKPGSHWVAVYLPKAGSGFYFDSFGRRPPPMIETFLDRNTHNDWRYNPNKLQGDLSSVCGLYCVKFLKSCPHFMDFIRKFKDCSNTNDYKLIK